jgi:transcriptional regulator with XRE-family HTH domain
MPKKSTLKLPPIDFGSEGLGKRLARIRKERGFTQVQLAEQIGIIQSLVSDYETDRLKLSAEMAVRFALAMGVTTDELLHTGVKKTSGKAPSRKVLRRLEQIEGLPRRKQEALIMTIDQFLSSAAS